MQELSQNIHKLNKLKTMLRRTLHLKILTARIKLKIIHGTKIQIQTK
jgi:hypothetical protein